VNDPSPLPGLHCIRLPTPFAIGAVNVYLAEGDLPTLIDCGVNTPDSYHALQEGLAAHGYRVADLRRLVLTHHHVDHVGLAGRIVEESGAEVWTHPFNVPFIETPEAVRRQAQQWVEEHIYRCGGVPDAVVNLLHQSNQMLIRLGSAARVNHTVNEGDHMDLAGHAWQAYHTPGHAGGLVVLYQTSLRMLLANDHLLKEVSSNALIEAPSQPGEPRPRRLLDYIREQQRIAALDIDIAYTGHGEPITDVRERVAGRLALYQQRADRLADLLREQPGQTLFQLSRRMFPQVKRSDTFLVLSEVLGHLDLLEQQERIIVEPGENLITYRRLS
jgi:glyoxylase-like metal-dependent hydrolase (beta-lactamase superfamily II)